MLKPLYKYLFQVDLIVKDFLKRKEKRKSDLTWDINQKVRYIFLNIYFIIFFIKDLDDYINRRLKK